MRRKLLQFQSLLAQHALRAAQKPRSLLQPHHHRRLHCPSPSPSAPFPVSPYPSAHLLWSRLAGATAASLLPRSATAVAAAARAAARGTGTLQLFKLQQRRASGWQLSASTFLRGAAWAYLMLMASPEGMLWMLIGTNVAVFILWRVADPGFMRRHFMISLDNFKSGRLHTLLTSAFSHSEVNHFVTNMMGLFFFGTSIGSTFGAAFLLKLYVAGALTGSAFFLLDKAILSPRNQVYAGWDTSRAPALGASAAVNAIILLHIFLYPKRLVYLYFVIPIPAAFMGAVLIGADLFRVEKGQGHVSGSAHLGGALVAALMWARIRKGWI